MDPITQITNKLMAERARQTEQHMHTLPPPPYTAPADDATDSDDDDDDAEDPVRLVINAQHHIQGSHNLVPTSPTPLADATKFSTLLINTVNQLNNNTANQTATRRKLKLDLTINCGVTVIGDRNVIGNVGVKPKPSPVPVATAGGTHAAGLLSPAESTVAGAKRRADEVSLPIVHAPRIVLGFKSLTLLLQDTDTEEPTAKRPALNNMQHGG